MKPTIPSGYETVLKKGTISCSCAGPLALSARYSATSKPSADCQKYFQREASPRGSRLTTFCQSSYQPIPPKPIVTISTTHT
ncbi:MAG: hypothetical protein AW12_03002 [Candidatus Accumulibacter sp. BA-94]|nr:MAG: hypothetical protein AW12_03002 [Candidatus Accumulibacter sp. BA-94]